MSAGPAARRRRPLALSDYPTGDGRPMAETPIHGDNMYGTMQVLRERYAHDPTVYVASNMMMYYVEGDKRRHVAPDVYVSFGLAGNHERDAYFTWVEGKGPDFIVEVTSKSTRREDLVKKLELYRDILKVPEYFLFDPRAEYLRPPLQGYRLGPDGTYARIEPDARGRLLSQTLGLLPAREGQRLRLYDPATGQPLLTPTERAEQAVAEARRAEAELLRMENQYLRAETERLRLAAELEALRRRPNEPS